MKNVFVIWKDLEDGMWHPVAKLTRGKEYYRLNYTQGSNHPNFIPFIKMDDKTKAYYSIELFAFFRNRLLPTSRPEFRKMLEWSDMTRENYDELEMLGVSGGARQTDDFRIIPQPELSETGEYKIRFFISGVRHLPDANIIRISNLQQDENLSFEFEDNNSFDCNAVLAKTTCHEKMKVGYCPKYFNCDIRTLLNSPELQDYSLKVIKVNQDAPPQYRLLCEFTTKWPIGFTPLVSKDYLAHTYHEEAVEI